jgi:hypothetical protein
MTAIAHKRGDTFAWGGVVMLLTGRAWAARCHLRPSGKSDGDKVGEITCALASMTNSEATAQGLTVPAGCTAYALSLSAAPAATLLWPAAEDGKALDADVEFRDTGDATMVISSATFQVKVFKEPTHD